MMRYAIVTLVALTSTIATLAVAQDGTGHGPPKSVIIVVPQPTTPPIKPLSKLFQPNSRLASMMK
jgi:hypothetical protein